MTDRHNGLIDERDILRRIDDYVAEEHDLRSHAGGGEPISDEQRRRLVYLEEHLDQAWDLLRQRRAKAEYGENPADARERPVPEVESYLQ